MIVVAPRLSSRHDERMRTMFVGVLILIVACAHVPAAAFHSPPRIDTFRLVSSTFRNERTIRVWLPPGYDDASNRRAHYPVLYLNDGFAVFSSKAWDAPATLERLVRAGELAPLVVVGIDNGATATPGTVAQRTREYVPYEDLATDPDTAGALGQQYPRFLLYEVVPEVERRYRVRRDAEGRGLGGSSYGGVAALFTIVHRPGSFGRLLIESAPVSLAHFQLLDEAAALRTWPKRVHIGAGTAETDDAKLNSEVVANTERLASLIASHDPSARVDLVIEPGAAHSGKAWGARLGSALRFLWPR